MRRALVAACLLCACGGAREATESRARVRVATQRYMNYAMLHIGKADSVFERHGIDVEWVTVPNSTESLPLLLGGSVDVLPASLVPGTFNAMARGDDVRIVATRAYLAAGDCTAVALLRPRGDAGTPLPRRVRASLDRGPAMVYMAERMLAAAGVDTSIVERLDIPHAPEMEALRTRKIDAAFTGEPWVARNVVRGTGDIWVRGQDALPDHEMSVMLFGRRLLREDRALGLKFIDAYREAVALYTQGPTPHNVAVVAEATGEDPEVIRQACWTPVRPGLRINLSSVLDQQAWMVQKGLVATPATATQIWDSTFVASRGEAGTTVGGR